MNLSFRNILEDRKRKEEQMSNKITLTDLLSYKLSVINPKTREEWDMYYKLSDKLLEEEAKTDPLKAVEWEKRKASMERKWWEERIKDGLGIFWWY